MITIVFTGGGTAGHVNPNLALIEALQAKQNAYKIAYIGSEKGIEAVMVREKNITYFPIRTGKWRRYFSMQNILDLFNVLAGIVQSYFILGKLKPDIVFSKGGFVGLPVVIAAKCRRITVIAHESDLSPGLANRLSLPFVDMLCTTFDNTKTYFSTKNRAVQVTGTPIRSFLFNGDPQKGRQLAGISSTKPCLLVMGGSQGSSYLNQCIWAGLSRLLQDFSIIHLCGKGQTNADIVVENYYQSEYAKEELAHFFAASTLVLSRAGANAVYEILACKKPHILVPLSRRSSRGDQLDNAAYFKEKNVSEVIYEDALTPEGLYETLKHLLSIYDERVYAIEQLGVSSSTDRIVTLMLSYVEGKKNNERFH